VFLSDRRAVLGSDVAAMLWEDAEERPARTTTTRAPARSPSPSATRRLLADLGTSAQDLLDLCAEEGLLPADVLTTVCERAGCDDVLERLREG
jgi:putative tRNA adenosine deaminase-associated protein